ncbi:thiamine pyrophosphate-binding protein [Candidatus Bathyarchaeota archaeon]|jgi:acetolactate synthase I/II/III large subunit|nr:thiamine pyrophosphate-binding protein [Candidatus Bathyarchaeota archaeon]MBT4320008.1 thiamine pyrophosphate-binding protein [Candidatus Bathyarchaeota archaeon]MBT4423843.1 thiamine pyrophosphate-binding protein [Candidatus Bathyarchaeota archaeon]MBT7186405.1 thiamine pyrophosphate-binding protein [Candidatus Bathyarchaeota archaeon]
MNSSRVLLEMLKNYDVEHVFGLPGETTLPLYKEWLDYPEIKHVMARDERSSAFMADGYARFTNKPGVCEAPSVGSTHILPGVAEAYKASLPVVFMTSDIPLHLETRNMLTGLDQTSMFSGITKETYTITNPGQIPHTIRRAFRVATTGKPGPVHIRLPYDILQGETVDPDLYSQKDFTKYPGHRPVAETAKIVEALKLLGEAENPVIIAGQGALYSQAWDELVSVAEMFIAPVGTTINAKGVMPEMHPLSIGVIGARGGTTLSNRVICEADLIFFVGSSTDSAGTDKWTVPGVDTDAKIIQLDISEHEAGNNYDVDVILIGDAKATLGWMLELANVSPREMEKLPRIQALINAKEEHSVYVAGLMSSNEKPIHPVRFIKELQDALPDKRCLVMDVGTSAIYTSTFYKVPSAGRSMAYNFAMGSLGYALPTSVGASIARQDHSIATLVGDGSFGLAAAELETISRIGLNNNVIVVNNSSFGWIRAEWKLSYGDEYVDFATNFNEVDYPKIAEGFGLKANRITRPGEMSSLKELFHSDEPSFTELVLQPEDMLVPPVPIWIRKAEKKGVRHVK